MASRLPGHPPEDFERIFNERGRLACEVHFKAGRRKIDAWLREIGKAHLIEARSGAVARIRQPYRRLTSTERRMVMVEDSRPANPRIAAAAAQFLRVVRNGGWIVSRTQFGDWRVGTRRLSPRQLIEMAEAKGFDAREVATS